MERQDIRRLLWRWGRVLERCRSKQLEMQEYQDLIEAQRGLAGQDYSGMPKGNMTGNPTERAAMKLVELTNKYAERVADLAGDCEKEMEFGKVMDEMIGQLSGEQQRIAELRYKSGHGWTFVAFKMCLTEDRVKQIDRDIVDAIAENVEIVLVA
jgi:DNA-directed RNA polymerase specialized sigma subunit